MLLNLTQKLGWRPLLMGGLVVGGVAGAAVGAGFLLERPAAGVAEAPAPPPGPASPAVAAAPVAPGIAPGIAPGFDVVRVDPRGRAVIAGRAEAGAEVTVFDGTTVVARARADQRGSFVALPESPLAPGGRALTLAARDAEGQERRSEGTVMVVVPAPTSAPAAAPKQEPEQAAVAVLVPSAGAARVLQAERRPSAASLDVVEYAEGGAIRFSGGAAAGARVRLYVDDRAAGDAAADAEGRWSLTPGTDVPAGLHRVRVDALNAAGRVVGRVELPFQRATAAEGPGPGRAVVQPGQSLWRIARTTYGSGVRYTVIYLANREQIRNPALIYPGQTFAVPAP